MLLGFNAAGAGQPADYGRRFISVLEFGDEHTAHPDLEYLLKGVLSTELKPSEGF